MNIINPATNEVIKTVEVDNADSIGKKLSKAKSAQVIWSKKSLGERISCIQKFSDLLDKNIDVLSSELTLEVGKPLQESKNEINGAKKRTKFFVEQSQKWLTESEVNIDGNTHEVLSFDALGVIANISAWNYPYLVGVNVIVPALIAGNSVLYKPSEFATMTGLNIARLLHEAGVPEDVFSPVIGDHQAGSVLLDLPLDGYFFTGSFKTGKLIAEKVVSKLVPVGLELGGKDPLYVTDELLDTKQVAAAVAEGCFYNNGQSCCAVERIYVHENVYNEFMEHFLNEVKALKVGNPIQKETNQGAVTRSVHLAFLEDQIKDALTKGATLLFGGKKLSGSGNFFMPTVLSEVNHTMRIMTEETFGPVIGVMRVKNDQEAVAFMNDSEYGLTAAIYSKNIERAKEITSQINSGTTYINCCDRVSPYLPWAGRKHSGLGVTLSYLGILTFTKPRGQHIRIL